MEKGLQQIMDREIATLDELLGISKTIASLAQPDDVLIASLIARREELLVELKAQEEEATRLLDLHGLDEKCRNKVADLRALALALQETEASAARNLEALLESLRKKTVELEQGRVKMLGYVGMTGHLSRFTDKRG